MEVKINARENNMKPEDDLYNIEDVLSYQLKLVDFYKEISYAEKYQIAYLGYLRSKENYKPKFGKMSLSYACRYIRAELMLNIRRDIKANKLVRLPDGNLEEYEEDTEEVSNPTVDYRLDLIKGTLHKLTEIEEEVIVSLYFASKPKRLQDLADKFKVTPQRIHQIKEEALKKIKTKLT